MAFSAEFEPANARLRLRGDCRMADAATLSSALAALPARNVTIDVTGTGEWDIGPAWLLYAATRSADAVQPLELDGKPPRHFTYFDEFEHGGSVVQAPARHRWWLARFGEFLMVRRAESAEALRFGGRLLLTFATVWRSLKRLRLPSIVRHTYETGVQAIPVVAVIAFLISVISAYIGAQQLRPFGAEIFTVDLVAIGVLRELGVLLTAIMVAGRTGSAYAAELGVMKLNDEVDALESMGMDPFEVLVLPRVIGLVIAMPLLTVVADFMGVAGGGLMTRLLIDLPLPQFFARLDAAVADTTFWAGMIKAPVFGAIIALTGTRRGLEVRESSRELGRLTTVAVVQSIFLVIFADALFAVFFLQIDF
jgi:phospholipid/cholesterol/gamma-HCH transport system permease protein